MLKKIGVVLVVIGAAFFMTALGFAAYGLTFDVLMPVLFGKAIIALLISLFPASLGMFLIDDE